MPRRQTTKIGKLQSRHKSRTPVHHKNNGKQTMRAKSGKPKTMKTQMVGAGPVGLLKGFFRKQKPEKADLSEFAKPNFAKPTDVPFKGNPLYEGPPNAQQGTELVTTTPPKKNPPPEPAQLPPSARGNEYAQPNPPKTEKHIYTEPTRNPNPNRNPQQHYSEAGLSKEQKKTILKNIHKQVNQLEFYDGFYIFITSHTINNIPDVECCSIYRLKDKKEHKLELLMSYLLGKCNESIHEKIKGITKGISKTQTLDDKKFFVYRSHRTNNPLILCTKPLCYMQNQSNSGFRLLFNDLVINDKKILYTHIPKKIPIEIDEKISFTELENPQFIDSDECDIELIYDANDTYMELGHPPKDEEEEPQYMEIEPK